MITAGMCRRLKEDVVLSENLNALVGAAKIGFLASLRSEDVKSACVSPACVLFEVTFEREGHTSKIPITTSHITTSSRRRLRSLVRLILILVLVEEFNQATLHDESPSVLSPGKYKSRTSLKYSLRQV